jgi:hypothetical protein
MQIDVCIERVLDGEFKTFAQAKNEACSYIEAYWEGSKAGKSWAKYKIRTLTLADFDEANEYYIDGND